MASWRVDPVLSFFSRARSMGTEEAIWASVPYTYAERTRRRHGQRIAEDIARRLRHPAAPAAVRGQLAAAATHNTFNRLDRIAAPTLVVHGEADLIVPPANAELLANAIPRAQLEIWPGVGHFYPTDDARLDARIASFLEEQSPEQPPVRRALTRIRALARRAVRRRRPRSA